MTDFLVIMCYKRMGYNLNVMRQFACLVINPIMVNSFNCSLELHAGGSGVRLNDGPDLELSF